jgi:hypothetical protein
MDMPAGKLADIADPMIGGNDDQDGIRSFVIANCAASPIAAVVLRPSGSSK